MRTAACERLRRVCATVPGDRARRLRGAQQRGTLLIGAGEKVYEAKSTSAVWTFRMVDDDLLNATAEPDSGASATTSFKRVGD